MSRILDLDNNLDLEKTGEVFSVKSKELERLNFNTHEISTLFEKIKTIIIENGKGQGAGIRATQSVSKVYSPQIGYRIYREGINWEVHRCYEKPINLNRYATREKIHIFESSLEWLKSCLDSQTYDRFFEIFESTQLVNQKLRSQFQSISSEAFLNQLMLIKYSSSSDDYDYDLNYLGSTSFGDIHDDETLFSIHLGDSSSELMCFNYKDSKWERISFKNNVILLLGQYSMIEGCQATSHRLLPDDSAFKRDRYSLIVEHLPAKHSSVESKFSDLHNNRVPSEDIETFFLIDYRDRENNEVSKEVIDFTEQMLRFHYFFEIKLNESKITRMDDPGFLLDDLFSGDRGRILYVEPGFVPRGTDVLNKVIESSDLYSNKYFISFHQWHSSSYLSALNWNQNNKQEIKKILEKGKVFESFNEYPFYHIDAKRNEFGSGHVYAGSEGDKRLASLDDEKEQFRIEVNKGFDKVFLFNTENYKDLELLSEQSNMTKIVGLSSGFKVLAIWKALGSGCSNTHFVDINKKSLSLKRRLLDEWDGRDFPSYLKKIDWNYENSFLSSHSLVEEAWSKELQWWGSEENFARTWNHFRETDPLFKEIDLVNSIDDFQAIIPSQGKALLWVSNVWYNEFTYSQLGGGFPVAYKAWLESLISKNPELILLQAPETTLFCGKMIHGKTVKSIYEGTF